GLAVAAMASTYAAVLGGQGKPGAAVGLAGGWLVAAVLVCVGASFPAEAHPASLDGVKRLRSTSFAAGVSLAVMAAAGAIPVDAACVVAAAAAVVTVIVRARLSYAENVDS